MSEVFGATDTFALEANLVDVYEGRILIGSVFMWVCGVRYGDPQELVSLNTAAVYAQEFLQGASVRERPEVEGLTDYEVVHVMFGQYNVACVNWGDVVDRERRGAMCEAVAMSLADQRGFGAWRSATLVSEIGLGALMDEAVIVVLNMGGAVQRIVVYDFESREAQGVRVNRGCADGVVKSFLEWIDERMRQAGVVWPGRNGK